MTDCGTERTLKPGAGTFAFEERVGVRYSPINACLCFTAELAIGFATLPIAGSAIGIEDKSRITLYSAVRGTNACEKAMPYAGASRAWWRTVSRPAWLGAKRSRSMQA